MHQDGPRVAIVDYGLGNLFSVSRACERVSLAPQITSDRREIEAADAVILPGVGAFGDAMANLRSLDLVGPLREVALTGKPLYGICLGLQLLMSESEEFGTHQGLNIIEGQVRHFGEPSQAGRILKVPQVGWNRIHSSEAGVPWQGTPLAEIREGTYMYFVHSFFVEPSKDSVVLSTTQYGDRTFCSAVKQDNVIAFQFHPERSGQDGINVYQSIARTIRESTLTKEGRNAA